MRLILASKSPRRREILQKFGYEFEVHVSDFDEKDVALHPIDTAVNNAVGKATATFKTFGDEDTVVLGADTVVYFNDTLLGKPTSPQNAVEMLKMLSGNTHTVVTGFALVTKKQTIKGHSIGLVTFNDLSDEVIDRYVKSGSPLDKAGGYGIQDDFPIAKKWEGSFYNIIGLPIEDIKPILDQILKDGAK